MKSCKMPVATFAFAVAQERSCSSAKARAVKSFTADISLFGAIPYGIFEVEVETPKYLRHPILQVKAITKKGVTRTISPVGN
jgi:hypothetical protein